MCKIEQNVKTTRMLVVLLCVIPSILIISLFTPMAIDKSKIDSYHSTTFTILNVSLSPSQGCTEPDGYYTDCFLCAETIYQSEWMIDNTRYTDNLVSCPAFDYTQFDIVNEEALMRIKYIGTTNNICRYFSPHPEKCFLTDEVYSMKTSVILYLLFGILLGVLPVTIFLVIFAYNAKIVCYNCGNKNLFRKFRKLEPVESATTTV